MNKTQQLILLCDQFRKEVTDLMGEGHCRNDVNVYIHNVPTSFFTLSDKEREEIDKGVVIFNNSLNI
jgi:hypothetical protein